MKKYIILILFCIISLKIKAQDAMISVQSFVVHNEYLQNGKIVISNATPTTKIKYDVSYSRTMLFSTTGHIKTRLTTWANDQITPLSIQTLITLADFAQNVFL